MQVQHPDAVPACAAAIRALVAAADGSTTRPCWPPSRCAGWSRAERLIHVHLGLQDMLLAHGAPRPTPSRTWTRRATGGPTRRATTGHADPMDHIGFLHRLSARPTAGRGEPSATCG